MEVWNKITSAILGGQIAAYSTHAVHTKHNRTFLLFKAVEKTKRHKHLTSDGLGIEASKRHQGTPFSLLLKYQNWGDTWRHLQLRLSIEEVKWQREEASGLQRVFWPCRYFRKGHLRQWRGKYIYGLHQAGVIAIGLSLCLPDPVITQTAGRSKIRRNFRCVAKYFLDVGRQVPGKLLSWHCLQDARQCA